MPGSRGAVLIVGAGLAGVRCAEALRRGGHRGRIVVAGDEPVMPYKRPALSKSFLAGREPALALALRSPDDWGARGIDLRIGSAIAEIDPAGSATTVCGSRIAWDSLVFATGARARRLPGAEIPGVHHLRTLADATALQRELQAGHRLVIVGAGFIGLEVASIARELELDVTLVAREHGPLGRALGPVVGSILADRVRAAGVRLLTGADGAAVRAGTDGRAEAVTLAGGAEVECDIVLVAIGAEPASELARAIVPIAADGGIATDQAGRTDRDGVFACGDVASAWRPSLGDCRAIGHSRAAAAGARAVAAAILGRAPVRPQIPYARSYAFGLRLEVLGGPPPVRAELSLEAGDDGFAVSYRVGGALCCAVTANRATSAGRGRAVAWERNLRETSDDGLATHTPPR